MGWVRGGDDDLCILRLKPGDVLGGDGDVGFRVDFWLCICRHWFDFLLSQTCGIHGHFLGGLHFLRMCMSISVVSNILYPLRISSPLQVLRLPRVLQLQIGFARVCRSDDEGTSRHCESQYNNTTSIINYPGRDCMAALEIPLCRSIPSRAYQTVNCLIKSQ